MAENLMPVPCDFDGYDASVYLTQPYVFLCSKHACELAEHGSLTLDLFPPLMIAAHTAMLATIRVACPICHDYYPIEGPGNVFWHIEWAHDGTTTAELIHQVRREARTDEQGA